MTDASSLGVTAAGTVNTVTQVGYNSLFASSATAVNIGTLTADSSSLNVMSSITKRAPQDYYTFNFNSGSAIKLAFTNLNAASNLRVRLLDNSDNIVGDNQGSASEQSAYNALTSAESLSSLATHMRVQILDGAGNVIGDSKGTSDQQTGYSSYLSSQSETSSTLRVQLFDVTGAILADSAGTTEQKAAYTKLTSSTGLDKSTGQYYVKVSYADTSKAYTQSYNFQLYSGTSYDSSFVTTALTQAYDPNLFNSVSSSISASSSSVHVYNRAAKLASTASAATATSIGSVKTNETALNVTGTMSSKSATQDYKFSTDQNGKIKLNFNNVTNTSDLHVRILDSTGKNVIADNAGTSDQKLAYQQLNSAAGLSVKKGDYIAQVTYADNQVHTDQKFNFQIYSGRTYRDFMTTATSTPTTTATKQYQAGKDLNIYADYSATVGTRQAYNKINATAADAINVGWLQKDTSALSIYSRLTTDDSADYYSFSMQQGNSFKMAFTNSTNASELRIQIMDITGSSVIADNQGTKDQKAAFAKLTSDTGLTGQTGSTYVVKVSYGDKADKSKTTNYNFQLYSGTKYTKLYKTYASAQTLGNYLLSGGASGYTKNGDAASMLNTLANGGTLDIMSALSTKV